MYRAMIAKDAEALEAVLDEGFVLIHMTGMRQDKRAFIQTVLDGTLNYHSCRDESIDVKVNGANASLIGKSQVNAAVFGGGKHTWRLEQDLKLAKRADKWLITLSKACTY